MADHDPAAAERAAFEAQMQQDYHSPCLERRGDAYWDLGVEMAWRMWQARAALAAPKADGWQQELEVDSYTYDARGHAFNIMQAQQRDGSTRWKVSDGIAVLNIHGEWEFEPSPSTRDDGFLARCRFDSPQSALAVLKRSLAPTAPAPQEESHD
ncbi:hypothetical protein [uncultured Pseudacidovorax sp.]|uniref:hypothetical protein n=1 Tax=uncultured Pseudacidovorax sp. TaxID=679313 RepID=UPI0025E65816|nr:hypothetical protein [uncultured Pseudacidovorax sp.]